MLVNDGFEGKIVEVSAAIHEEIGLSRMQD